MNFTALNSAAKRNGAITQCSSGLLPLQRKFQKKNRRSFAVKAASYGESGHRRSIVDEDMLVLRKRMHQLRMEEINYIPPQQWMEWEKKWYPTYDSDVCSSLLWLQNMLLNTRPSIVMAALAVISFSVPTSVLLLIETSIPLRGVIMEWFSYLHG